jgi:hypothetical protein
MEKSKEYYDLIVMKPVTIRGDYTTRTVWLNNKEITPEYSRSIYDHSPEFDWGSFGDGPAQLALAILLELTKKNKKVSMILHHIFKNDFLSYLPQKDFKITINIGDWFFRNIHRSGIMLD